MPGLLGLLRPGLKEFRHLRELILKDLFEFAAASADLQGYDACSSAWRFIGWHD